MADLTTETHVAVAVVGAVAGAAVIAVAAPILVPIVGIGAAGVAIVAAAPVIGATIGGWLGWKAGKPDEATIQKLKS